MFLENQLFLCFKILNILKVQPFSKKLLRVLLTQMRISKQLSHERSQWNTFSLHWTQNFQWFLWNSNKVCLKIDMFLEIHYFFKIGNPKHDVWQRLTATSDNNVWQWRWKTMFDNNLYVWQRLSTMTFDNDVW